MDGRQGGAAALRRARAGRRAVLRRRLAYMRDLTREMVVREVRAKYKRSALGLAWAMLNPLLHLMVFYFVFQVVLGMDTPRFTAFGLTGLLVWGWSAGALSQSVGAISNNANLLRQPRFPVGIIPPIVVATHLVYFLFALPVLAAYLLLDGSVIGWTLTGLPLVLLVQYVFTLAAAYLVAALNACFRDTAHFLDVLLRLLMFVSPIFYEASRVPEEYQRVYGLNPLVPLLQAYRALLMHGTEPDWYSLTLVGVASTVVLALSARLYAYMAIRTVDEL